MLSRVSSTSSGGASDGDQLWHRQTICKQGKVPRLVGQQSLAHDLLNASLALQTEVALQRTGISDETKIFVEGGFRNNASYLSLLGSPLWCRSGLLNQHESSHRYRLCMCWVEYA